VITLALGLAGALGAACRLVLDGAVRRRLRTTFPWATVAVNVSGSLLLGVLTGLVLYRHAPTDLRLIAGTGFCGGYTTFSTASVETVRLAQRREYGLAVLNGVGTAVLTLGSAAVGLLVVR
jgi:fluoride exporter